MASDREKVRTAYRMAGEYVRRTRPGGRVFIVHRLDRDTSGVLLFAKDEEAKRAYQEHWDALVRRRGYLAVVEGRPPGREDTIRTLLRENAAHKVYSVRSGGKGGGDPLPHHPGGAGVHPAGGGHRHRAQEPDPRPPERAGLPRRRETGTTARPPARWAACASTPTSWLLTDPFTGGESGRSAPGPPGLPRAGLLETQPGPGLGAELHQLGIAVEKVQLLLPDGIPSGASHRTK